MKVKEVIKNKIPKNLIIFLRLFRNYSDILSIIKFILDKKSRIKTKDRISIILKFLEISYHIECPHKQYEILQFFQSVLKIQPSLEGCIVEAGVYKGGSTCKFSKLAKITKRKLIIFDSFKGIPKNEEKHEKSIFGEDVKFKEGSYQGSYNEVVQNIKNFGDIDVCEFKRGWFEETLPKFSQSIVAVYIDVDLASSTKSCLKYFYPLLVKGGVFLSQDGHLPLVIDVFNDDEFWEKEVGFKKPIIKGLGKNKLIIINKI